LFAFTSDEVIPLPTGERVSVEEVSIVCVEEVSTRSIEFLNEFKKMQKLPQQEKLIL